MPKIGAVVADGAPFWELPDGRVRLSRRGWSRGNRRGRQAGRLCA